jgi:hypothetical protein
MRSALLFVLLAFALPQAGGAEAPAPDAEPLLLPKNFPCGRYEISGRFEVDNHSDRLLKIYADTTSELPILVTSVPTERAFALDGSMVKLEVELERVKGYPDYPRAKFVKFVSVAEHDLANRHPLRKIKAGVCGS